MPLHHRHSEPVYETSPGGDIDMQLIDAFCFLVYATLDFQVQPVMGTTLRQRNMVYF